MVNTAPLTMCPSISLPQFPPLPHPPPPAQGCCLKEGILPTPLFQPSFHSKDLLKSSFMPYITLGFNFLSPCPALDTAEQPGPPKNQPHSSHHNGFKHHQVHVPHS